MILGIINHNLHSRIQTYSNATKVGTECIPKICNDVLIVYHFKVRFFTYITQT